MFKGILYFVKYCWKFDKRYILLLFLKQLFSSGTVLMSIILPKYIIDSLFVVNDYKAAIKYIVLLIILSFLSSMLINIISSSSTLRRTMVFKKFQLFLCELVMKADFCQLENAEYLETRNKAYKYLYGNGIGFAQVLENSFQIIGYTITFAGVIGIIGQLSLPIVVILIILVLISTFFDSYFKKKNIALNLEKSEYERRGGYYTNTCSDFRYGKEIRAYNLSNWLLNKYSNQLEEMETIYKKISQNQISYGSINSIIGLIQQVCLYIYIIIRVTLKQITVGDFSMYLSATSQFTSTLRSIMHTVVDLRQYSDYFEAFEKFLNMNKSTNATGKIIAPVDFTNFNIEFINVSYKYDGQTQYALKDICIKFNSHQKIAIVGENGSGKSTFIKLLLRIYKPTQGKILLNGIDIQNFDYAYYSSLFSAVFQDFKLFSMPLKDNIILNSEVEDENFLNKILKECGVYQKVCTLEKGVDTFIYKDFSKNGFEPSGGESQKIAIARALYRKSPIVILDEPTAALDPRAESEIYSQFNKFFNDRFIIFISHRFAVTKFCDKIVTFKEGKIVENGSHKDLIALKGTYAELFQMQADYYN